MTRLLLLLALVGGSLVLAAPAGAETQDGTCDPTTDTVLVLEFGSLEDGEIDVECVPDAVGKSALDALGLAGVEVEQTSSDMPMVCRIDGEPEARDEKCTETLTGDGYWAFMVAQDGEDWTYAPSGAGDHTLEPGQFVAFKYHLLADGETVFVRTPATEATRLLADVPDATDADDVSDRDDDATESDDDGGFPWVLVVALVALVLVAGAAFVLTRRRSNDR